MTARAPAPFPFRPAPSPAARLRAGCAAGALLGALAAGPALADLSAQEVRDEFEAAYEGLGMTVEAGGEEAADGAVTLSDVVLSFEFTDPGSSFQWDDELEEFVDEPDEEVRVEASFAEIAFEEREDGTVRVTLPPENGLTVRSTDAETGEEVDAIDMSLVAEGFEMTVAEGGAGAGATGDAEPGANGADAGAGRRYGYTADRLGVALEEATLDGEPLEGEAEAFGTDVSGSTAVEPGAGPAGEATRYAQSLEMAELVTRVDLDLALPEDAEGPEDGGGGGGEDGGGGDGAAGRMVLNSSGADVVLTGAATLPPRDVLDAGFADEGDPGALLDAGLAAELAISYGPSTSESTVENPLDPSQSVLVDTSSEGGSVELAFGRDGVSAAGDARGVVYVVEGEALPTGRVEAALDRGDFGFAFPLVPTEEPVPFTLRYDFSGLTLNEEVWALFDPEDRLPRDPASLMLAFEGGVRLLESIFDEEAQAEAEEAGEFPAEIEEASMALELDAVGARVEASGEFTFDNEDTTTFPGVPAPTGTIVIDASGIDPLLDTLVDMGLVAPDQLTPARLMLGLFARSDEEGGYDSEISVDGATGAVTANGQRLR